MKLDAKILSFSSVDGKGVLITSQKQRLVFSVNEWDDFETMPALGLEVECFCRGEHVEKIVLKKDLGEIFVAEHLRNDALDFVETPPSAHKAPLAKQSHKSSETNKREESITISMNLPKAVQNYFNVIKENITKRQAYKRVHGRLDYLLVRRFLWTAFNNVSELDLLIVTPKIKALSYDLRVMTRIYDDFMRKIKHPPLAYEEVFLSCQSEYLHIRDVAQMTLEKLSALRNNERVIGEALKARKEELEMSMNSDQFDVLKDDFKSMNGAYVDVVHMMAELDERYKHDMKLLVEFEKEYREDFYKIFQAAALEYKREIIEILSAQAYVLDTELWHRAKESKAIKAHFHKAGISGALNTKTYLKYYLDSLDPTKATEESQRLYELYEYLSKLYKDSILIVVGSASDAMDYEQSIRQVDKDYEVKAFIDEKSALQWAMKHSVKILILEDRLAKMAAESFLHYYKRNVLLVPKIIILGNSINSGDYAITKLLNANISARVVAQHVQELIQK